MARSGTKLAAAFGISFVWFTTQFGGGFASGAQLKAYFIQYGIFSLVTCIGAQAIAAFYNAYIAYYCKKHGTHDYRSFNNKFYGKYAPVFSNLFELVYIFVLLIVPAVAFATGGSTLAKLTGIPYLLCTSIIGVFIFVVAIYGTAFVRKVATMLSVLIVAGLLVVFIPNIYAQWGAITDTISEMTATKLPVWPAVWSMIVYAAFQIAASPAIFSQHSKALEKPGDATFTFTVGFFVNSIMVFISTLGLLAIVSTPEYAQSPLPVLVLIEKGVGAAYLMPILSVLIILGAVSTAVNMVSAGTARICKVLDKNFDADGKPTFQVVASTLILCLVGFGVAQFGLIALVAKGYGFLGYLTFPVILIPYLIHMVVTNFDRNKTTIVAAGAQTV
jgi:uncharacterized membrane protein YkvI